MCAFAACQETDQTHQNNGQEVSLEKTETSSLKIWEANIETTQGFTRMNEIINDFSGFENTAAYTQLKSDLLVEYKLIFKNCTMKGEAHDQLHQYIMPFSDWFKGLSSGDLEVNKSAYDAIKAHLEDYKNRFK
jgi:hypothetical protein